MMCCKNLDQLTRSRVKPCEVVVHLRLSIADENCPIIYHGMLEFVLYQGERPILRE